MRVALKSVFALVFGVSVAFAGWTLFRARRVFLAAPADAPGSPAALIVAIALEEAERAAFILTAGAVVGGGALALLVGRPLKLTRDHARRAAPALPCRVRQAVDGDRKSPPRIRTRDEIGELFDAVERLAIRLEETTNGLDETSKDLDGTKRALEEAREALRRADAREDLIERLREGERLTILSRLASGFAHELGTPLNVISGRAMMISSGEIGGPDCIESAKIIVEQSHRMTGIIQHILGLARKKSLERGPVDVRALVADVFSLVQRQAERGGVSLHLEDASQPTTIDVDSSRFFPVLANLVANAIRWSPKGGRVTVGVERNEPTGGSGGERPSNGGVSIYVRDQGPGMRKEDLQSIFKPLSAIPTNSLGTSIDLAIVQGIVREHGGFIDVESEPGCGSCFRVRLPEGGGACRVAS